MYIEIHVCIHIYIYIYTYACVYIYIYQLHYACYITLYCSILYYVYHILFYIKYIYTHTICRLIYPLYHEFPVAPRCVARALALGPLVEAKFFEMRGQGVPENYRSLAASYGGGIETNVGKS